MFRKYGWQIILPLLLSICTKAVFYFLSSDIETLDKSDKIILSNLGWLATLTAAIIGLLIGLVIETKSQRDSIINAISENSELAEQFINILSSDLSEPMSKSIRSICGVINVNEELFVQRAEHLLSQTSDQLSQIENGVFDCGPDEELKLTKQALGAGYCQSKLMAISYQDEAWWGSAHGRMYLSLHKTLKSNNPELSMIRIFIVDKVIPDALKAAIKANIDVGVNVKVITKDKVPDDYREDFVIYDNRLVRTAGAPTTGFIGKTARFSKNSGLISEFTDRFEILNQSAKEVTAS